MVTGVEDFYGEKRAEETMECDRNNRGWKIRGLSRERWTCPVCWTKPQVAG